MTELANWLRYADLDRVVNALTGGPMITTNAFTAEATGSPTQAEWRSEEWQMSPALTPVDRVQDALHVLQDGPVAFSPGWHGDSRFDFADVVVELESKLRPWTYVWTHPLSQSLVVSLRDDFCLYHLLVEKESGQYFHPIDDVLVAEVQSSTHAFYDDSAFVCVHRDYLRDYLAARRSALVISIVSDRFVHAPTLESLGVDSIEQPIQVSADAWIRTTVHQPGPTLPAYRGRGTLWTTAVIMPFDRPKAQRSPWPSFRHGPICAEPAPTFILDADGTRGGLADSSCARFLHFRPAVLQKYLSERLMGVRFHMRNWGRAWGPGEHKGIDVGFNELGVLNAFAPDLSRLPHQLQAHWSAHSVPPSGGICAEMFQTRMQLRPPDSPSLDEVIRTNVERFNHEFRSRFNVDLYASTDPPTSPDHLSVGPVTEDQAELLQLAKVLYRWVLEGMSISALRTALPDSNEYDKDWRQIRLLAEILGDEAESVIRIMRMLNDLRIADAHVTASDAKNVISALDEPVPPGNRARWLAIVDGVAGSLKLTAQMLRNSSGPHK